MEPSSFHHDADGLTPAQLQLVSSGSAPSISKAEENNSWTASQLGSLSHAPPVPCSTEYYGSFQEYYDDLSSFSEYEIDEDACKDCEDGEWIDCKLGCGSAFCCQAHHESHLAEDHPIFRCNTRKPNWTPVMKKPAMKRTVMKKPAMKKP